MESYAYKGIGISVIHLQDVYDVGYIKPAHIVPSKTPYQSLPDSLREELDLYLDSLIKSNYPESYISAIRSSTSRFMLFLSCNGFTSVKKCTFDVIFEFFIREDQPNKI